MILSFVCLCVWPSVTLHIVALRVGVGSWKLYCPVRKRTLPIHFFKHFCCKMYRLATKHGDRLKAVRHQKQYAVRSAITATAEFLDYCFWLLIRRECSVVSAASAVGWWLVELLVTWRCAGARSRHQFPARFSFLRRRVWVSSGQRRRLGAGQPPSTTQRRVWGSCVVTFVHTGVEVEVDKKSMATFCRLPLRRQWTELSLLNTLAAG